MSSRRRRTDREDAHLSERSDELYYELMKKLSESEQKSIISEGDKVPIDKNKSFLEYLEHGHKKAMISGIFVAFITPLLYFLNMTPSIISGSVTIGGISILYSTISNILAIIDFLFLISIFAWGYQLSELNMKEAPFAIKTQQTIFSLAFLFTLPLALVPLLLYILPIITTAISSINSFIQFLFVDLSPLLIWFVASVVFMYVLHHLTKKHKR